MSINLVILLGNVGKDPDIRAATNGDRCASFSLATSEFWKDKATGERKETTHWHNVVCWNQALVQHLVEPYVKKGSKVHVSGKLVTRKWQDKDGADHWTTEVVIGRFDGVLTLEGKPPQIDRDEHSGGQTTTRQNSYAVAKSGEAPRARTSDQIDDDIPF